MGQTRLSVRRPVLIAAETTDEARRLGRLAHDAMRSLGADLAAARPAVFATALPAVLASCRDAGALLVGEAVRPVEWATSVRRSEPELPVALVCHPASVHGFVNVATRMGWTCVVDDDRAVAAIGLFLARTLRERAVDDPDLPLLAARTLAREARLSRAVSATLEAIATGARTREALAAIRGVKPETIHSDLAALYRALYPPPPPGLSTASPS